MSNANVVQMRKREVPTQAQALAQQTRVELADHLRDAARNIGSYVDEYADYLTGPKRLTPPVPRSVHPLLAQLARELMRDAEVGVRRSS
jgi:hypothetical protein